MITPAVVAHADWGIAPRKRQLVMARLLPGGSGYQVVSIAPAPTGQRPQDDVFQHLHAAAKPGQAMIGFDFPIGLPIAYAKAAGISSFPEFLDAFGSPPPPPPWHEFAIVARHRDEITLHRPFYPDRPGGTKREHLYLALGLTARELRRRGEGTDAEALFWTLGGKQVGKGALAGWHLLAAARRREPGIALWPFDGPLPELLAGDRRIVVAETYPREFYQYIRPPVVARWSKRRQADRRTWVPGLLRWADLLAVSWHPGVLTRVEEGFSAGPNGEDEFDAVVGLLGMIAVVTGTIAPGEPADTEITTTEGWILGRSAETP